MVKRPEIDRTQLKPQIEQVWQANLQGYGADKVWRQPLIQTSEYANTLQPNTLLENRGGSVSPMSEIKTASVVKCG
ncbi:MAG: hypothetical protein DID91_2727704390 [Candidatus Nitrotoga sp. MKT]|nr:MAG: hypothetical protein DID91_2727704390 [Candidatus Nitrotoga sp. MKT]